MGKWWIGLLIFIIVVAFLLYSKQHGLLGVFNQATGAK